LLYRLKYRQDRAVVAEIGETAAAFVRAWQTSTEILVPVPPSRQRAVQPVLAVGADLAARLGVDFCPHCVRRSREAPQLKDVFDYDERWRLLEGLHEVERSRVEGRTVLLFDDLFRSGATMNSITAEHMRSGKSPRGLRLDPHSYEEQPVTRVFVGGSRKVNRLAPEVRARLDRIMAKGLPVVLGDANGADKAVQRYFSDHGYTHVEVFCSDAVPRNSVGDWPVRVVRPGHSRKDFDYYSTKDRAMAAEATVGLMLWDGESHGTLMNVLRLNATGKPTVVHVQPTRSFVDIRTPADLMGFLAGLRADSARRLRAGAGAEGLSSQIEQASLPLG